ncbi:allantoinase AllB [Catellatospora bangladeshensis]|uniref:allantoinase n=1 Tax=Catellatospora bangladeshensis TaxID=310355 RepID=A0A8J3JK69_9ACTN|nr:allantoinase AllB [Catellatospora bangladeshensis]GIF81922.1 allantoinase [Catellatospora bangladeshensis]
MNYDLILRSRRTLLPGGEQPADVGVRDGVIAAVAGHQALTGHDVIDLGECALLPGLVDTHVHVNEPGRTEWEGFDTATRAAAAGGVTTIVDMPLNSIPPTVDPHALWVKRAAAAEQCYVDVGFWGGAVPGNLKSLPALHEQGVFGFKAFLIDSGVPEFPPLDPAGLADALAAVDALFVVHAEDPALVGEAHGTRFADFVASRPARAEASAVAAAIEAARHTGARVHILHLAAADALPLLAAARREGVRVTAETCPHYLVLDAADVPDGATQYKCCPPIRDRSHQDALWEALADGLIDCVVSDHSPCPPELKRGDFGSAWGGIASVQLGLPLVWTAARRRGHSLADVVRWMAANTAGLVGLGRKGRIAEGADADLVAFDADAEFTVDAATLLHRHHVSPYHGRKLRGVVRDTWLRGRLAGAEPIGRLLERGRP